MTGPYKIGTLARLSGFSPALLRAWERRFSLLDPVRGPGGQRMYTDDDRAVLMEVRAAVDQGRSISEIASAGRHGLLRSSEGRGGGLPRPSTPASASAVDAWRTGMVSAALSMDGRAVSAALDEAIAALGPALAMAAVIEPVAVEVGRLWAAGRCSVASEHLVSETCLLRVRNLLDTRSPAGPAAPRIVAACFPDEQHQLGLAIVSWHVSRLGLPLTYLGPSLPLADLVSACQASPVRVVLLSVTRRRVFAAHQTAIARLAAGGDLPAHVFIGGQGVPSAGAARRGPVVFASGLSVDAMVDRVEQAMRSGVPAGAPGRRPS